MPNRYEREIEEILRNLEQTDPKPGLGQRLSGRPRQPSGPRRPVQPRFLFSFHLSTSEWLLVIAVISALVGGGYAYLEGGRPDILSDVLAIIGFGCVMLVAFSQFLFRPRRVHSIRYGNTTITPLHRSPFSNLKTRWNLFWLKLRYRRKRKP